MQGMARTPEGPNARTVVIPVRFSEPEAAKIDRLRGDHNRSDYLRRLVYADAQKRLSRGGERDGDA